MSAPLVVNTRDGVCWTRRTVTSGGLALYAPEGVCSCPEFVVATLAELAEHGIAGSADVLPVPVGTAEVCPVSDFFQPGHTYTNAEFPEYGWKFRVDVVTTHPENAERTALGWRFFKGEWEPYAYHEDDWDVHQYVGHVDATEGGAA